MPVVGDESNIPGTTTTSGGNAGNNMGNVNAGTGLPGLENKDYQFVRGPNGQIYAVYTMKTKNGASIQVAWRIDKKHYDALGINPNRVQGISGKAFQNVNVLGTSNELSLHGDKRHPFQQFLKSLREQYGNVPWLRDSEYVSVLIEGYAEGLDETTIANKLTQTKWYQSTTATQRQWLSMGKADRDAALESLSTRIADDLNSLYGEVTDWQKSVTPDKIKQWAKQIASGKFGDSENGYQMWLSQRRAEAEKIEGSQAWIDKQSQLENERQFMNRPEDMYEQLRQDAIRWLGPANKNMPFLSKDTLKQWATDLVTQKKSEADWQQFLRRQSRAMYPFLGTDQTWMEFADPYKAMVERLWGRQIDWSNSVLQNLSGMDANGVANNKPLSFSDFETKIRSTPQFWSGPVAREEGYDTIAKMRSIFQGVS